ncbi:MAG: ATP-binding protein [Thermoanaerobaculia bacterium]
MNRAAFIFDWLSAEGEKAIDELIYTRKSEELFLDFKRSADEGAGGRLNQKDRENLARALSGFANSEGGVIVWGIDCRPGKDGADIPLSKIPLVDSAAFVSWFLS